MATFGVSLKGDKALMAKLRRMGTKARKGVAMAVDATAIDVQDGARNAAPIDTGTLIRSIQIREVSDLHKEVFTNVPYAARQNWGFFGTDSLGRSYNQPGYFYMEKGAMEGEQQFLGRVQRAVARAREGR